MCLYLVFFSLIAFVASYLNFILFLVSILLLVISSSIAIFPWFLVFFLLGNSICCLLLKLLFPYSLYLFLLDLYFWNFEYFSYKYFVLFEFLFFVFVLFVFVWFLYVLSEIVLFFLDYPVSLFNVLYFQLINCRILLCIWFSIIGRCLRNTITAAVVIVVGCYSITCFCCFVYKFYVLVRFNFVAGYFYLYCNILFDYL